MQQLMLFDVQAHLLLPEHLITYEPGFFSAKDSERYLATFLKTVPFQQSKVMMYDKEVVTPRLTAWFGDRPIRDGDLRQPIKWTPELLEIKEKVEAYTETTFNGVLLNYYRDGNDSVAWHSDKDTIPGLKTQIASVSFGQARNFDFRNKDHHKQQYSLELGNGSLLVMKGDLQKYWEHRIAKSTAPMTARINLTFRKIM